MARGMHLTIDEWFYHWFAKDDTLEVTSLLFEKMFEVCDKIVIQKGSRLAHKFFELVDASSMYPPKQRNAVKQIVRLFITNSIKVFWVDDVSDLPDELIPLLPRKDLYLIQICLATKDKILVTSDTTLYQNLLDTQKELGIKPFMVLDFMNLYPNIM